MNEMDELRRLREDVPASLPVTHAETALLTAMRAEATAPAAHGTRFAPGRAAPAPTRLRLRLALAGGLSLAAAAGITAAVVIPGSGAHPTSSPEVRELAYRAAAAASKQANVSANHWVYWQEQQGSGAKARKWQVWTTADGQKAAYRYHGKVHFVQDPAHKVTFLPDGQIIGQPVISIIGPPHGAVAIVTLGGKIPIRYNQLSKLPGEPHALVDYLGQLPMPGWGKPAARAFAVITELIQTYVMPPKLTAELYKALAAIPGVTVDKHAIDLAGRPGVGFEFGAAHGEKQQLVLDPHSYRLMAVQLVRDQRGPDGHVVFDGGTAILRMALVKGAGVLP